MPRSLFGFVFQFGRWHQAAIAALSLLLFVVGTAPLEIQRRIINAAAEGGSFLRIFTLVIIYLGLALSEGAIKFVFNLYTSWIGEFA
ncbi:MAG: ABC transporter ATP-binding protein, partial [Rhizobiaceae bacterium]|nr:ABC transporter ATP-binding protein [Rhizobiaceae bacterium]